MLCGLFMLIDGAPILRSTVQFVTLTFVAEPTAFLPAHSSISVSTHTSPTPGVAGSLLPFDSVFGYENFLSK